jgi:hypothetical protein
MMPSRRHVLAGAGAAALAGLGRSAQAANPGFILGKGPAGHCDDATNGSPIVKWNAAEKQWWMWYYCRDSAWPKDVASAFGTGRVALAKSPDGIQWTRFDGPLTGGAVMEPNPDQTAFDCAHIGCSDIMFHEGEWLMWYFGGDATVPKEIAGMPVPASYQSKGMRCRPGVARSKDGVSWTRIKGAATGGAAIEIGDYIYGAFPSAIHDGKRFLMYYSMLSPKMFYWEVHVAESTDLVNWRPVGQLAWDGDPEIWELGGSVTRHILPNPRRSGPKWLMVYTSMDSRFRLYPRSIAAAVSDDALRWRRLFDKPILHPGEINSWDGAGTSYGHLVPAGKKLHLYYYGYKDEASPYEPGRGIGLAISETGDLQSFRKYRG